MIAQNPVLYDALSDRTQGGIHELLNTVAIGSQGERVKQIIGSIKRSRKIDFTMPEPGYKLR